jgi:hypothetical protein
MGRNGQKDVGQTKVVRGARYVRQSIATNTPFYDDNLTIMREYIPDESVDLVYLGPRWTWLWPGGCGGDTSRLTSFSNNGEPSADTL